tara:strand:+ start:229 stop:510 length:282 start_codon:yes stop_codon:yes gene_type:complete
MGEMSKKWWQETVEEYYNEYGEDTDFANEWVDGLLPIYYYDIKNTFDDMNLYITKEHVGLEIWKVMIRSIFDVMLDRFYQELNEYIDIKNEEE